MDDGNGFRWSPSLEITVTETGRHELVFPEKMPLLLKFYQFSFAYHVTPNVHDFFEISYIYQGTGTLQVENKRFPLRAGDTFVVGDSEFHTVVADDRTILRAITVLFLPRLVYSPGGHDLDLEYLCPFYRHGGDFANVIPGDGNRPQRMLELMSRLHGELQSRDPFRLLAVKNCLLEGLLLIARHFDIRSTDLCGYNRRRAEVERMKNAFRFIESNFQEPISLKEVADSVYMSESYFCKVFKRVTGCTLKEYILRMKIDRARQLLMLQDLTVSEIADRTGFASLGYFDRIFRRLTGVSPHDFKARIRTI